MASSTNQKSYVAVTNTKSTTGKNIVLCFDGTLENFGPQPFTNVLKIFKMLDTSDNSNQICLYQPGIGVAMNCDYKYDNWRKFTASKVKNVLDGMFAFSLEHHIISAYKYLMNNYEYGDKVYMFGFSRGAFIARVLAAMIERVGLLNKGSDYMLEMAWKIYESWEYAAQPAQPHYTTNLAQEFKRTFSRDYVVKVYFQGLFDSVNSVGIIVDKIFPCTQRSNVVEHVRHAVSLDERRGKFKQISFRPSPYGPKIFSTNYKLYCYNEKDVQKKSTKSSGKRGYKAHPLCKFPLQAKRNDPPNKKKSSFLQDKWRCMTTINSLFEKQSQRRLKPRVTRIGIEGIFSIEPISQKNIEPSSSPDLIERFFPGDHSDIGGGWADDENACGLLSNIPLKWILAEAVIYGVKFKPYALHEFAKENCTVRSLFAASHDKLTFKENHYDLTSLYQSMNKIERLEGPDSKAVVRIREIITRIQESKLHNCPYDETKEYDNVYKKYCGHLNRVMTFVWWSLELIPIKLRLERRAGVWYDCYIPNLGSNRYVAEYADIHWSVIWRMRYHDNYRPRNLPPYAVQVLKQEAGIIVAPRLHPNSKTIVSPVHTYPEENQITRSSPDRRNDTKIGKPEIPYGGLIKSASYHLKNNLNNWDANGWSNVPDDLRELLEANPRL